MNRVRSFDPPGVHLQNARAIGHKVHAPGERGLPRQARSDKPRTDLGRGLIFRHVARFQSCHGHAVFAGLP